MATPNHTAPSTAADQLSTDAVGTAPSPSNEEMKPILLAPPPEPMAAPTRPSLAFGAAITCVVLVFAFVVSSFAVRNSDFWLHLASGRLLAQGEYHFGVDNFTFSNAEAYWVNHA